MSGSEDGTPDWRAPALAAAAWAGMWAGTAGTPWLAAGGAVVAAAAAGFGWWRSRWLLVAVALALGTALGIGSARVWTAGQGPLRGWAESRAVVVADLRLGGGRVSAGGRGGPVWTATATLLDVDGRGQRWASGASVRVAASGELLPAWAAVATGATVRAVVRLGPARVDEPVVAWAQARASPQLLAPAGAMDAAVTAVRTGLRESVAGLPPAPRALVPALVVGDTDGMPEGLTEQFRVTGLTHLTAVSGANLTLLLVALLWVSARLGLLGWWRRWVAVAGVVAFVLLCRAEPSVLRAAAMGLVGLAALGWSGPRQGLRYLAWAVVGLLLADPWLCRSPGFVLSVCASAGIVVWARRWALVLGGWLPAWLAEAITVPVAAQLATQPIVTAISGQVSLVGVLANLLAAPLVGPGTVLGFLAAALGIVSPALAAVAGWAAGGFAQAICWVAEAGAALPGAAVSWPASPPAVALLAVACVLALAGLPLVWARPWLVACLALALVVVLLRPLPVPGWPPTAWQVVSCDVGQGDATVVNAGGGRAVVVDAGPEPRAADRCLDQLGVTEVTWLVLTHLHADHVGGVAGVASGRRVANVLVSGIEAPEAGWRTLLDAVGSVPRTRARPGLVLAAGGVQVAVLAMLPVLADGETGEDSTGFNDASLVMRVTSGPLRLLLAGDVEQSGQEHALAFVTDLRADVLLVPHHGSGDHSAEFLRASGARVALFSVGAGNDYGHPAARTVQTVAATGAQVYRTDLHGSVAVALEDATLVVTTQRQG